MLRSLHAVALCARLALSASAAAARQEPEASPTPTPAPTPRHASIAASIEPVLEKMEAEAVEAELRGDPARPLHFETTVEVRTRTPEELLARFLDGPETRLAPPPGSPPSVREMDEQRDMPPQPNLLALAGVVADWLGGRGEPRFFLYRVIRADGSVQPLLRDRPVPAGLLVAAPDGSRFEEVGRYASQSEAINAYRRLEAEEIRVERERGIAAAPAPTPPP